jgi:hypothetical protein
MVGEHRAFTLRETGTGPGSEFRDNFKSTTIPMFYLFEAIASPLLFGVPSSSHLVSPIDQTPFPSWFLRILGM